MIVQKIEKKQVKSRCDAAMEEDPALLADPCMQPITTPPIDHKKEAVFAIESAIEHLAEMPECPECLESIGNLSIVLMDLRGDQSCTAGK